MTVTVLSGPRLEIAVGTTLASRRSQAFPVDSVDPRLRVMAVVFVMYRPLPPSAASRLPRKELRLQLRLRLRLRLRSTQVRSCRGAVRVSDLGGRQFADACSTRSWFQLAMT